MLGCTATRPIRCLPHDEIVAGLRVTIVEPLSDFIVAGKSVVGQRSEAFVSFLALPFVRMITNASQVTAHDCVSNAVVVHLHGNCSIYT
jgi:hypothetical protein